MPDNDDAAQKLIDAILPKLTESLLPQLTEAVEKQIKGVLAKNDELIEKLGTEKTRVDDFAKLLERHDKQMAEAKSLNNPPKIPAPWSWQEPMRATARNTWPLSKKPRSAERRSRSRTIRHRPLATPGPTSQRQRRCWCHGRLRATPPSTSGSVPRPSASTWNLPS